jgi:hypothetical protein
LAAGKGRFIDELFKPGGLEDKPDVLEKLRTVKLEEFNPDALENVSRQLLASINGKDWATTENKQAIS